MSVSLKQRLKYSWIHPRALANRSLNTALRQLAPVAHGRMLDVGCGRKPYQALFAPFIRTHVGVDMPSSMHGVQQSDALASAMAIPFAAASFDTVLATEVLEHVATPTQMIAEISRVLRPGGTLILSVPFHEPLHELPYDYFRYTEVALTELLAAEGLHVRRLLRRGGAIAAATYLLTSFLYRRFGSTGYPGPMQTRPIAGVLVALLCAALQIVGARLDRLASDEYDTMGYVVHAEKENHS